jgi:hypothetical protein
LFACLLVCLFACLFICLFVCLFVSSCNIPKSNFDVHTMATSQQATALLLSCHQCGKSPPDVELQQCLGCGRVV